MSGLLLRITKAVTACLLALFVPPLLLGEMSKMGVLVLMMACVWLAAKYSRRTLGISQ